ncbi:MAG: TrbI/VirB10 family protein [Caulobacteraceae bacterium]|nr:TrbI/VirB10 family protein [Caulobacteraceae bacterium]
MTDASNKTDPAGLTLRARPRRIVRFKRGLLIAAAAIGCASIAGVTWFALKAHPLHGAKSKELYNTDHKPPPDALAGLPSDYGAVPQLGPPLPGDLGRGVVNRERQLGQGGAGPSAQAQAAEAERQRLAQQETQAREAGVLAQTSAKAGPGEAVAAVTGAASDAASAAGAGAAKPADRLNLDPDHDQNSQQRKLDFLAKGSNDGIYDPHTLQTPASPYEVMAGSIISASLITGLDSDLPGTVVAQVTENVFDSATGQFLLIPQGARLIGTYDSVVAFGQSRALLAWQRIILPDGSSIQIDNLPATDVAGYAGLSDQVDYHTWTLLKGIAMSTLLGVGTQVTFGNNQSDLVEAIRESTQESASQAGQRIVEKDLNIQPTLKVRPGWPLRVIVHKDLVLRRWIPAG